MVANRIPSSSRLDAAVLATEARFLYRREPNARVRLFQGLRPHICPLEDVMEQVPVGSRVLDVGCGAGLFLLLLARQGRVDKGYGFDVAAPAIQAAQRAARDSGLADCLDFQVRSIEDGIPSGPWNVVSVVDVIHHVPSPHQRSFVASLCDRVPVGGRLIIKDMVSRPYWRALANQMHDLVLARQWVHHVGPDQVDAWVESHGLRRIYNSRIDRWWYGHWTMVYERPSL